MARRAQSTSPQKPQHETTTEARWWKVPAVIAAVIAALATISVAIINQRGMSKPKSSDAPHIQQQTYGPDSPSIAGVQGNVTVTKEVAVTASSGGTAVMQTGQGTVHITNIQGISEEQHTRLAKELGVTQLALGSFFKILEQQQVAPGDLDSTLHDIAKRYKDLQDKLRAFASDDPAVVALKQAASKALDAGDFAQAEKLLNEASQKDLEGAQQFQEMATKRWLSAAASKAELGALKDTQLRYAEAATYYRQAAEWVESLPKGSAGILATYLNHWAESSMQAGDYRSAEPPFRRALALQEQGLGPEHRDVAISLNNLAALYRAQGRYAEAEPFFHRALAIHEKVLGPEHPQVAAGLNNRAEFYRDQSRYGEAEPLSQRALAIREKALGPEHPQVATSLENYAALLRAIHRVPEAGELEIRAKAIRAKNAAN